MITKTETETKAMLLLPNGIGWAAPIGATLEDGEYRITFQNERGATVKIRPDTAQQFANMIGRTCEF